MNIELPDPVRNGDILPWAQGVTEICRRFGAMGTSGMLARGGAGGVGFEPIPANLRDRRGGSAIPGRFAITLTADEMEDEEEEQTYTATFANPYYDIGGRTYELAPDETQVPPVVQLKDIKANDFIVLRINARETRSAELLTTTNIEGVQSLQDDYAYCTIPLYRVAGGLVVCDFRMGPVSSMGEF